MENERGFGSVSDSFHEVTSVQVLEGRLNSGWKSALIKRGARNLACTSNSNIDFAITTTKEQQVNMLR